MKQHHFDTTRLLNELYQNCLQREADYRAAFRQTQDSDLRYLFSGYSLQRAKLARELGAALAVMGVEHEDFESADWQPPTVIPSCRTLLADTARREEAAIELYREVLATDLSETLRALLLRQVHEIEVICERLHRLHSLAQSA